MANLKGFGKFLETVAPAIPIVGGVVQNVLNGMNTRAARKYETPKMQLKRMREAGMPMAASSQISTGGRYTTSTAPLGTESYPQNIGMGITRAQQRKQLEIMQEELKLKGAEAAIAAGNAKNVLNPSGVYENTNQGLNMKQAYLLQNAIREAQEINTKYLPNEKQLGLWNAALSGAKTQADTAAVYQGMQKTRQDIKNMAKAYDILLSEEQIRKVQANYSERMSQAQLSNLWRDNNVKLQTHVAKELENRLAVGTLQARLTIARNEALKAGETVRAMKLGNALTELQNVSSAEWYRIQQKFAQEAELDNILSPGGGAFGNWLYLQMFPPGNGGVKNPSFLLGN